MSRKKRKNKTKKIFRKIILIIVFIFIIVFALKKVRLNEFINNMFGLEPKNDQKVIKKLKIVDEDSDSRPVAVMINNNHAAWPHAGLQDSYINYEIIVEGGITRIMSIFKDKDTAKIGSVRSARHYFIDYALENDAIFVHYGFSEQAEKDIKSLGVNNINGLYDNAFWRDKTLNKAYEHTAFTNMEKINSYIEKKEYRNTTEKDLLLNYTTEEVDLSTFENSKKADRIEIEYSSYQTTYYNYDPINRVYLRSMDDEKHVDAITKKQYSAKNIIVYQVYNYTIDSYKRQEVKNIGSGEGYYITNGYAVPITWEKSSRSSQTIYKYKNGKEIDVNDGNTWIQIQPKDKELNIVSQQQ